MTTLQADVMAWLQDFLRLPAVKSLIAFVTLLFMRVHGPWTVVHWAVLMFIVIDSLTGMYRAHVFGEWDPHILRVKFTRKFIGYGIILILSYQLGAIATDGQTQGGPVLGHVFDAMTLIMHGAGIWIAVAEWESIGRSMKMLGFKRWPTIEGLLRWVRQKVPEHHAGSDKSKKPDR